MKHCDIHETHDPNCQACAMAEGGEAVTSTALLAAADTLRTVEQSLARAYEHMAKTYTRDAEESYFKDRQALLRAQWILTNEAELLEAQGS